MHYQDQALSNGDMESPDVRGKNIDRRDGGKTNSTHVENESFVFATRSQDNGLQKVKIRKSAEECQNVGHIYSARIAPSSRKGFNGLYIFSLGCKLPDLFKEAVTVKASREVGKWKLLGDIQGKPRVRVGSPFPSFSIGCLDIYGNQIPFKSVPEITVNYARISTAHHRPTTNSGKTLASRFCGKRTCVRDSIAVCLAHDNDNHKVEQALLRKDAVQKLVKFFQCCPEQQFLLNGLTPLLIARLDHQDAIARLNLLKLIKAVKTSMNLGGNELSKFSDTPRDASLDDLFHPLDKNPEDRAAEASTSASHHI
uniref:Uncharacterized protein n=1 Tax=Salix viminalis TaxID=40686 RepID=A0A6N2LHD2_SALVM